MRRERHVWTHLRQPRMREQPHWLVFLDETSTTTKMTRLRGRAPCGNTLLADAPFGHWGSQTFIAGLTADAMIAPCVILDNFSVHKSQASETLLKAQGNWLLFLPPYSPDLNPIEMAFSKLKAHLRRLKARTLDDLWRAVGNICDLFDPIECWNYFRAAGYAHD